MSGVIRSHEDLKAWQAAVAVSLEVYRLTQAFPADERFGLIQQLRRAAVSVPSNIAEGYGRGRGPDFLRFLRVARGSLYEVETQMLIASRLGYLDHDAYNDVREKLAEAGRILAGLIRSAGVPNSDH